jgi:hypothetical protein
MLVKKKLAPSTITFLPIRTFDERLQDLYARRSAVEALIQSIEKYDLRTRKQEMRKRITA